jgi:hypothetical protein
MAKNNKSKSNKNRMGTVFCPQKAKVMPANSTVNNELRCCGCGLIHAERK